MKKTTFFAIIIILLLLSIGYLIFLTSKYYTESVKYQDLHNQTVTQCTQNIMNALDVALACRIATGITEEDLRRAYIDVLLRKLEAQQQ